MQQHFHAHIPKSKQWEFCDTFRSCNSKVWRQSVRQRGVMFFFHAIVWFILFSISTLCSISVKAVPVSWYREIKVCSTLVFFFLLILTNNSFPTLHYLLMLFSIHSICGLDLFTCVNSLLSGNDAFHIHKVCKSMFLICGGNQWISVQQQTKTAVFSLFSMLTYSVMVAELIYVDNFSEVQHRYEWEAGESSCLCCYTTDTVYWLLVTQRVGGLFFIPVTLSTDASMCIRWRTELSTPSRATSVVSSDEDRGTE